MFICVYLWLDNLDEPRYIASMVGWIRVSILALSITLCLSGDQNPPPERVVTYVTYLNAWKGATPVKDLQADEIAVKNHAGMNLPIQSLRPASQLPLTIALVFDGSGSRRDQLAGAEMEPAIRFVRSMEPHWKAAVVRFTDEVFLHAPLDATREQLEGAVKTATSNYWGPSAPYDALVLTTQEILARPHQRRAIIIISDGVDNSSIVGAEENVQRAQETAAGFLSLNNTMVYFLRLRSPGTPRGFVRGVERLVERTGGIVFEIRDKADFDRGFERVADALRAQYVLTFQQQISHGPHASAPTRSPKIEVTRSGVNLSFSQVQRVPDKPLD